MENEILHKPNQTIMINSTEISVSQRKAYNILLHIAQKMLKDNNNQFEFSIPINQLLQKTGLGNNNHKRLEEDLRALKKIEIEIIKDNGDWRNINLISEIGREDGSIVFDFSSSIRKALINNDYYTTLDLLTIKRLTSKYSVILYEMAIRYKKVEIPKLTIEEFKELTGSKTYKNFSDLRKRVISPAVEEIKQKTDIELDYEIEKKGMKTISIKFKILKKEESEKKQDYKTYSENVEKLFAMLPADEQQIDNRKAELEKLLQDHTEKYLAADIKYCNKKKTNNYWGYFLKSINEGHYSKDDIEKEEKKKAKQQSLFEIQSEMKQEPIDMEKVVEIGKSNIQKIKENIKNKTI